MLLKALLELKLLLNSLGRLAMFHYRVDRHLLEFFPNSRNVIRLSLIFSHASVLISTLLSVK